MTISVNEFKQEMENKIKMIMKNLSKQRRFIGKTEEQIREVATKLYYRSSLKGLIR